MQEQDGAWLELSLLLMDVYDGSKQDLRFGPHQSEEPDQEDLEVKPRQTKDLPAPPALPQLNVSSLSTAELQQLANAISPHAAPLEASPLSA